MNNELDTKIIITNGDKKFYPAILNDISLDLEYKGNAGMLKFKVLKDEFLSFFEGNTVEFYYKGEKIFRGFIFTKQRSDNNFVNVTAFDQIRYLKNKDTFNIFHKKSSDVLLEIANDFNLEVGYVEDTKHVIPYILNEDKTFLDIIYNSLHTTFEHTGETYILYDDFGKLTLKNSNNMKVDIIICEENCCGFDYSSSIDDNTYNEIIIKCDGFVEAQEKNSQNIEKWGLLRLVEKTDDITNASTKAVELLETHNKEKRTLSIKKAIGDVRVKGGSKVFVKLNVGDIFVDDNMLVESVKHHFKENEHFMDLKISGGAFSV